MKYTIIILSLLLSSCGIQSGYIVEKKHVLPNAETYLMKLPDGDMEHNVLQGARYYVTIQNFDGQTATFQVDEQEYIYLIIGQLYRRW